MLFLCVGWGWLKKTSFRFKSDNLKIYETNLILDKKPQYLHPFADIFPIKKNNI
jgi:hypothetical protein